MLLNQTEGPTHQPKEWQTLTCPCCGFSFPPKKFSPTMKQILYPVRTISGGGRARGFHVKEYFTWDALPRFQESEIWSSILCLYTRLGSAYDHFYRVLGFLSPEIEKLVQELQKGYAGAYLTSPFSEYTSSYPPTESSIDYGEPYSSDDYPAAYSILKSDIYWR